MKFIHTADLHLGKVVNGYQMLEDQEHVLNQVKEYIEVHRPDALIIAGDIYDRAQPPASAIRVYNEFLASVLMRLKTPVLAIAGNHDGADFLEFGRAVLEAGNYYVSGRFSREPVKVTLEDAAGVVNFYLLPFADYEVARHVLEDDDVKSIADGVSKVIDAWHVTKDERNVLIGHNFVIGSLGEAIESDSEKTIHVGGKGAVSASCFKGFDYVALGHLHRVQTPSEIAHYSGSILKYSQSEVAHEKSVTLIEMDGDGRCEKTLLPLIPLRDMRHVKGELEAILADVKEDTRLDYLHVTLTDVGALIEPMAKLRNVYPNVMTLRLDHRVGKNVFDNTMSSEQRANMTPEDMFAKFYEIQKGIPPSEERITCFENVIKELKD